MSTHLDTSVNIHIKVMYLLMGRDNTDQYQHQCCIALQWLVVFYVEQNGMVYVKRHPRLTLVSMILVCKNDV